MSRKHRGDLSLRGTQANVQNGANNSSLSVTHLEASNSFIPPPSYLDKLEQYAPGSTKTLVELGVEQARHDNSLELKAQEDETSERRTGQGMMVVCMFLSLLGGIILVWLGAYVVATAFISCWSAPGVIGLLVGAIRHQPANQQKPPVK